MSDQNLRQKYAGLIKTLDENCNLFNLDTDPTKTKPPLPSEFSFHNLSTSLSNSKEAILTDLSPVFRLIQSRKMSDSSANGRWAEFVV